MTKISETQMLMGRCVDPDHLHAWIRKYVGIDLPRQTISRFSNSNPLDFAWRVYSAIMEGRAAGFLAVAGRDSGKCQVVGTKILCEGSIKRIEHVNIGDRVWDGISYQKVTQTFEEGYLPGCEIITDSGFRLHGSLKHRVWVMTPTGIEWKHIKDLTTEDYVVISTPNFEPDDIDQEQYDWGYFIGLLIGDGGVTLMDKQNRVSFTNTDPILIDWFLSFCKKEFGLSAKFDGRCSYIITNGDFRDVLYRMGFHSVLSVYKNIPQCVWDDRSRSLGFLAGFYDTDGTYEKKKMLLSQSNQKMLEEVQILLASFGVFSSLRLDYHELSANLAWNLEIPGAGINRLLSLGFRSKCSIGPKVATNDHKNTKPTQANPIPSVFAKEWIRSIDNIRSHGKRIKHIKKSHLDKYESVSREKLIKQRDALLEAKKEPRSKASKETALDRFDPSLIPSWVMNLENIHVDKVTRVRFGEGYFYDLSVENSHSYWSNGLISHNTLTLSIIDLLSFLHDARNTVHIAMTGQQASRARTYLEKFINKEPLIRQSITKQNVREIRLNINGEEVGLEVIPATPKAVQGAHCALLTFDEIASSMEPSNVRAYRDAHGIVGSSNRGKPGVIVKITSRQKGHSLAEQELREASKTGTEVLKWTTLDMTERCPEERSGTIRTPLYVHTLRGTKLTEHEFLALPHGKTDGFIRTDDTFDKCRECSIAAFCFLPGTPIRMFDGTLKPIEQIRVGDLVYTHTGNIRRVYDTMERDYSGVIVGVDAFGQNCLVWTTPEHPFLCKDGWKDAGKLTLGPQRFPSVKIHDHSDYLISPRPVFGTKKTENYWEVVSGLIKIRDGRVIGLDRSRKDRSKTDKNSVPLQIELDYDWGLFCGLFLAEGSFGKGTRKFTRTIKTPTNANFHIHRDEQDIVQFLRKFVREKLSGDQISEQYQKKTKELTVSVGGRCISELLFRWFGEHCDGKKIPDRLLQCNKDFLSGLFHGSYWGDGGKTKGTDKTMTLANPHLVQQLQWIALGLGIHVTLNPIKKQANKKDIQNICWSDSENKMQKLKITEPDRFLCRLRHEIETKHYSGKVYNFSVEQDESYVVHSLAVHNCAGDLKKQKSKSILLRKIDDVINKIRMSGSWDWGVAQIMSLKPSSEGLIYFEFDRLVHTPGWEVMWKVLTGEENPHANRDSFMAELKRRRATFYAGVDWGWSSPSTCVVMAVDKREYCYVIDAIGRTYTPDPEFIELIRTTVYKKYDIQMFCPDLANGSGNALLRQAGLPTTDDIDKSINLGINLVKGLLRIPGTNGQTRVFFAPDLQTNISGVPGIIEELEIYKKKQDLTGKILDNEDPEEGNDHYLDPLRYMVWWLFGRMRMKVGNDFERPPGPNSETNIPSLDQIVREHGLQVVDNREGGPADPGDDSFRPGGPLWSWT